VDTYTAAVSYGAWNPPPNKGPARGPFLLVALHKLRHWIMTLFAGPIALYPRGCGQCESRVHRAALSFQILGNLDAGQGKGPGDGDQPGPNNRASLGGETMGGAVLKQRFAKLLGCNPGSFRKSFLWLSRARG
jgi:hypothetical protein